GRRAGRTYPAAPGGAQRPRPDGPRSPFLALFRGVEPGRNRPGARHPGVGSRQTRHPRPQAPQENPRRPARGTGEHLTMATDSSARYVLLNRLADEFAERYGRGERPSVQEYLDKHPDLADDILDLFPALVEIEQVKEGRRAIEKPIPAAAPALLDRLGDYR